MNERQSLGALWVHGEDAASFLNGQLTINVATLQQQWQIGAYCSYQGKVIALVAVVDLVIDGNHGYLLLLSADLLDSVAANLRKYVMRSKVNIDSLSITLAMNPSITHELATYHKVPAMTGPLPAVMSEDDANVVRLSGLGDVEVAIDLSAASPCAQDERLLKQTLIERGIALIGHETSEQFVPQMLGLHKVGGIDFDKGCYVGQEIIARMHYKGQVRRHLAWAETVPALGEKLEPNMLLYSDQRKAATVLAYIETDECALVQVVIQQGLIDKPLQLLDNSEHQFIFTSERTIL